MEIDEKKVEAEQEAPGTDTPEVSAETVAAIPREQDEIDALRNAPEVVEVRGIMFKVCAVSMDKIPELQEKLLVIDKVDTDPGTIVPPEAIQAMAEIAQMGLEIHHPHLTVDRLKKMPIGCFPPILMATLNLNDFFDGLKTVSAVAEATAAARLTSA